MDEVGRGALAGPVSVGVVLLSDPHRRAPTGIADSKLLTRSAREALVPRITAWSTACAVGHAEAHEIDSVGLVAALRLAGWRALSALPLRPAVVILDGSHDWLTPPAQGSLLDEPEVADTMRDPPPVIMRVRADQECTSVAAASIVAKVERDGLMRQCAETLPDFGWETNKGYAAPAHLDALARLGPSPLHRRTWSLPGGI